MPGPVSLQAPDPVSGDAGGPVPAEALLPGACTEASGAGGGAVVWSPQPGALPGAGASAGGPLPTDLQRAGSP